MKRSIGKWSTFLFGLLAGVLLGGAVAYVAFSHKTETSPVAQSYELEAPTPLKVTPAVVNYMTNIEDEEQTAAAEGEKTTAIEVEEHLDSITVVDSLDAPVVTAKANSDSIAPENSETDSVLMAENPLVLDKDSTATETEIVVRQDELVWNSVKTIKYLGKESNVPSRIDSLIEETSRVKMDERTDAITMEFWQSPINYKGYKLGKKKLLLYGIAQPDSTWLFHLDEQLYLKTTQTIYKLDYTNNFKPYRRVDDPNVVELLKQ
jgi:hypothetical protein